MLFARKPAFMGLDIKLPFCCNKPKVFTACFSVGFAACVGDFKGIACELGLHVCWLTEIAVLSCNSDNFVNYYVFSKLPFSEERGVQGEAVQSQATVEHQWGQLVPAQLLVPAIYAGALCSGARATGAISLPGLI